MSDFILYIGVCVVSVLVCSSLAGLDHDNSFQQKERYTCYTVVQ